MEYLVGNAKDIPVRVSFRRLYAGDRLGQIAVRLDRAYRPERLPPGIAPRSGQTPGHALAELPVGRFISVPAAEAEALVKARIASQIGPVRAPIRGWFKDLTSQLDGAEDAYIKVAKTAPI